MARRKWGPLLILGFDAGWICICCLSEINTGNPYRQDRITKEKIHQGCVQTKVRSLELQKPGPRKNHESREKFHRRCEKGSPHFCHACEINKDRSPICRGCFPAWKRVWINNPEAFPCECEVVHGFISMEQ